MPFLGEIAAIATAISWSACALFFTSASHRIGSFSMSHFRLLFGIVLLLLIMLSTKGTLAIAVTDRNLLLLGLSGIAGFFFADVCLFQSYVDIGPRLGALVFNTYPIITAIFGWLILSERLSLLACAGMLITIFGVFWVVIEKNDTKMNTHVPHFRRGVILAASGSVVQAMSVLLSKPALTGENGTDPLTATFIRAIFALAAYFIVTIARRRLIHVIKKARDQRSMMLIAVGAVFGPSVGVWLSMIAIKYAPVGIAATLMALMPVTILPMTAIVYKERISWRAVIGAVIACAGVAILLNSRP